MLTVKYHQLAVNHTFHHALIVSTTLGVYVIVEVLSPDTNENNSELLAPDEEFVSTRVGADNILFHPDQ